MVRQAPRGAARLRVSTCLQPTPLRGPVPTPRDCRASPVRAAVPPRISSQRSRVDVRGPGSASSWGTWTCTGSGMAGRSYGARRYARRMDGPCCAPGDERHGGAPGLALDAVPAGAGDHPATLVDVAAGSFRMGDDSVWAYPGDGEAPVHEVTPTGSASTASRSPCASHEFADATGWVTDAERYGWSFVFGGLLPDDFPDTAVSSGADGGERSTARLASPRRAPIRYRRARRSSRRARLLERRDGVLRVVGDTVADRGRMGGRRPRWSCGAAVPRGDALEPGGNHRMNVFQGTFPAGNTGADGYLGTVPVDAFEPNGSGLAT